jgi:hypothetical protein
MREGIGLNGRRFILELMIFDMFLMMGFRLIIKMRIIV